MIGRATRVIEALRSVGIGHIVATWPQNGSALRFDVALAPRIPDNRYDSARRN
jgi:hypothetical protein